MSGGSMDYVYLHIKEAAEITEDETITQLLTDIAKVLHDEEWADCCDITDAEYQDTLLKFKRKWLKQEPCEDCISRQAVLDLAEKGFLVSNGNFESVCKAINEIPSAKPQEPKTEQEPCEDCISKQAVLNILDDMVKDYANENDFDKAQGVAWVKVQRLPSVTPQKPKTGHWIKLNVGYGCSECSLATNEYGRRMDRYCPWCGAKMEEG